MENYVRIKEMHHHEPDGRGCGSVKLRMIPLGCGNLEKAGPKKSPESDEKQKKVGCHPKRKQKT